MKRLIAILLLAALLFTGCTSKETAPERYQATFLEAFDTVTTVLGYASDKDAEGKPQLYIVKP